jgi:hypothetical protein
MADVSLAMAVVTRQTEPRPATCSGGFNFPHARPSGECELGEVFAVLYRHAGEVHPGAHVAEYFQPGLVLAAGRSGFCNRRGSRGDHELSFLPGQNLPTRELHFVTTQFYLHFCQNISVPIQPAQIQINQIQITPLDEIRIIQLRAGHCNLSQRSGVGGVAGIRPPRFDSGHKDTPM